MIILKFTDYLLLGWMDHPMMDGYHDDHVDDWMIHPPSEMVGRDGWEV